MEANASRRNTAAVADGRSGGLRQLIAGLIPSRQASGNGQAAANGHVAKDDPRSRLEKYLRGSEAILLNDLRLPNGGGKIDHLVVGRAGITVIDSRHYTSREARVGSKGLKVGWRNRTDLLQSVAEQAWAIREVLAGGRHTDVPVEAALAWRKVEGRRILNGRSTPNTPRILVSGTRRIAREASRPGPLTSRKVAALASYLEGELAS
jgi:hypothetical protein